MSAENEQSRLRGDVEAFWRSYLATLAADHPHRSARPEAFSFGDSPRLADELADLVCNGPKRATASIPIEFTCEGIALPAVGDVEIVLRSDGTPVAILETVEVRLLPFDQVDAEFAAAEGEGDGSLEWWRNAHRAYFSRVSAKHGIAFDGDATVVCRRFRVVWPRRDES